MESLKKFCILGIAFWFMQVGMWGARFDLPAETPGLISDDAQVVTIPRLKCLKCKHITIPETVCNLYFPMDGSQPITEYAEIWSGAMYNGSPEENNRVTDWWVRVFGGNEAVTLSRIGAPDTEAAPPMGYDKFNENVHIMQAEGDTAFKRQFWETFRCIAEDHDRRVLLYRLLIEIRRVDRVTGEGCCGKDVLPSLSIVDNFVSSRNAYRSIKVEAGEILAFDPSTGSIFFNHGATDELKNPSYTNEANIRLLHEMLSWFLALMSPGKR